uniref:hypothetical protein n=1 Tax=Neisseria sicca TaxID=490 RepID=UPI0003791241|nr:hypothetical protein [Neisseria sicca]
MLSESRIKVVTVKVGRLFAPTDEQYPHYRLVPIETDRQGYLCLLFYIDRGNFLVLEPRIKRYAAVRRLSLLLENALYAVYETAR